MLYCDFSRKNLCVPEEKLVTVFCPLTTTGIGESVFQNVGGIRLVVDCKLNPAGLAGHIKTTFAPEGRMVSFGSGKERLNTVP